MSSVTVQEIANSLREYAEFYGNDGMSQLAVRIEAHGIAPPDGLELIADIEGIGCCTVVIRSGRVNIASETVRDIIRMGSGKVAPPDGMVLVPKKLTTEMLLARNGDSWPSLLSDEAEALWDAFISAAPEVKP